MKKGRIEIIFTEDDTSPTGVHVIAGCPACENDPKIDGGFIDSDMRLESSTVPEAIDEHIKFHMK